jgi:class 3 adenylate cyclase
MEFGIKCAVPRTRRCPQCDVANPLQAKCCGPPPAAVPTPHALHSRTPLSDTPRHLAERILRSRISLEGERQQVTALFADLKGSLELLADWDPKEARQHLDRVPERLMTAVYCYEGAVNWVMGDGVMALFGARSPTRIARIEVVPITLRNRC